MTRNKRTLVAPERWNIEEAKKVAADDTWWWLNCNHRAIVRGRTMKEYVRG